MEYDFTMEDGERAAIRVARALEQREALRRIFRAYLENTRDRLPAELQSDLDRYASAPADPPPRPTEAPPERYRYPQIGKWALELTFRAEREERWLCEARTLLMKLAAMEAQAKAHRRHREEDLAAVRKALKRVLANFRVTDAATAEEFIRLQEKLARAEALTVDAILDDRETLESLWP